ncbi:MAG: 50S ribosomal protein L4 [bacterium]|nr:50S ribosomal protein L4 [bacterium]
MKTTIYNQKGEKAGTLEMPSALFDVAWSPALVWQVAESERSNKRRGTAHTKDRSEVRGGGKKPWRQKGTGRARHGSIRSPIWIGGGVTHGPRSESNYTKKINKKMKRKAVFSVLSQKFREHTVLVLDEFSCTQAKTKAAASVIKILAGINGFERLGKGKVLVLIPSNDAATIRALRNMNGVTVTEARNLNVLDLLGSQYVMLPKESISVLEKKIS